MTVKSMPQTTLLFHLAGYTIIAIALNSIFKSNSLLLCVFLLIAYSAYILQKKIVLSTSIENSKLTIEYSHWLKRHTIELNSEDASWSYLRENIGRGSMGNVLRIYHKGIDAFNLYDSGYNEEQMLTMKNSLAEYHYKEQTK